MTDEETIATYQARLTQLRAGELSEEDFQEFLRKDPAFKAWAIEQALKEK